MSRPIELTLENLIPRHSGALPRELVELAGSLLAQSRNKCSNLKAEEEVARLYACANLACERLKTALNLPPIESRPPIPPRAYSKLYAYFDRTLITSAARARAQRAANSARSTPTKPLPQRGTPSKEQSFKSFSASTPTKTSAAGSYRTPKKGLKYNSKPDKERKIPKWIAPAIRLVCKELGTPRAIPHINAGVETLLTLPCPKPDIEPVVVEEKRNGKIPALIASIWYFVVIQMRGKEARGVETKDRQVMVRDILGRIREDEWMIGRVGEGDDGWKGWEKFSVGDVFVWNKEIVLRGWKEMDWFLNLNEGCGVEGEVEDVDLVAEEMEIEDGDEGEEFIGGREGRKTDTMHQKRYDYLSANNRAEYREWKEEILAMVKELRSHAKDTAMVDA